MDRQRLDHLVKVRSARFLCLTKNFDFFLEGADLLVLLLAMSTIVGFVNIDYLDCDNIFGCGVTAASKIPRQHSATRRSEQLSYHLYTRPNEPLPISSSKVYSGIEAPLLRHFSITIVSCAFAKRMASRRWWLTASADSGRRRFMMSGLDLLAGSNRLKCR
jgi:hypothetical protein